jgi:hypothetical protein
MSSTQDLVAALKAELRRQPASPTRSWRGAGLAESSVKRIFAKGDMPLSRIDEVLAVLKMDFAELARAWPTPSRCEGADAGAGAAVVADRKLLLVAICVLSQWTLEQIVHLHAERAEAWPAWPLDRWASSSCAR